jgi:hypothetical protein
MIADCSPRCETTLYGDITHDKLASPSQVQVHPVKERAKIREKRDDPLVGDKVLGLWLWSA